MNEAVVKNSPRPELTLKKKQYNVLTDEFGHSLIWCFSMEPEYVESTLSRAIGSQDSNTVSLADIKV